MRGVLRLLIASLTIVVISCSRESSESTATDNEVTLTIGGPIRDVSGVYWPTGDAVETLAIEKPRTITIRFPSGRVWTCRSQITFLSQAEQVVSRVEVAPLKEVSDFAGTASALQSILDELGVAADSPTRERLKNWRAAPPAWAPSASHSLNLELEQEIEMAAEIKPAHQENKWFLLCSFRTESKE